MAESMLLAALGCAGGLLCGGGMLRVLQSLAPESTSRIGSLTMDCQVFAVVAAIATVTGVVCGLALAWEASQAQPVDALKTTERSAAGKFQAPWRSALTMAEVALSLLLLIGGGLLLKSFVTLMGVDLGFQTDRVLAMNVNLPELRYDTTDQRLDFSGRWRNS
jgi:putative ABC transport system permease protein